jgi:hypothetical protein
MYAQVTIHNLRTSAINVVVVLAANSKAARCLLDNTGALNSELIPGREDSEVQSKKGLTIKVHAQSSKSCFIRWSFVETRWVRPNPFVYIPDFVTCRKFSG